MMKAKQLFLPLAVSLLLPLDALASSGHITITSILDKLVGFLQSDFVRNS